MFSYDNSSVLCCAEASSELGCFSRWLVPVTRKLTTVGRKTLVCTSKYLAKTQERESSMLVDDHGAKTLLSSPTILLLLLDYDVDDGTNLNLK